MGSVGVFIVDFTSRLEILTHITLCEAQFVGELPTGSISTPYALKAPELILGVAIGTEIDVWAVGCLVSSPYVLPLHMCDGYSHVR